MKSIDDKIRDIGFELVNDDQFGLRYRRCNSKFIEYIVIPNCDRGNEILQLYSMDEFGEDYKFNTIVKLKVPELELFIEKVKQYNK